MGETSKEEYKIQSFDIETQKLLKTALKGQQVFSSFFLLRLAWLTDVARYLGPFCCHQLLSRKAVS